MKKQPNNLSSVDIIWNITRICPWYCDICCVDAVHVIRSNDHIITRSNSMINSFKHSPNRGTIFDQAMAVQQAHGLELSFTEKLQVLEHLEGFLPKIDFSGGDPLSTAENISVIEHASRRFGRHQITLTATGAGLARSEPEKLTHLIGELNFTYDTASTDGNGSRPSGYAKSNLKKATRFVQAGVRTRAECPLTTHNIEDSTLRQIYLDLHYAGIDELLLMRLFPVGRGKLKKAQIPSRFQYQRAIESLREMESQYKNPLIKLQCAIKFLERQETDRNTCDLVYKSLGLMPDGTLLTSPWAYGYNGQPLSLDWVLGNLARTPLKELLVTEKAQEYYARLDENFGHCKIFAFIHSPKHRFMDRIFDNTDPLFS